MVAATCIACRGCFHLHDLLAKIRPPLPIQGPGIVSTSPRLPFRDLGFDLSLPPSLRSKGHESLPLKGKVTLISLYGRIHPFLRFRPKLLNSPNLSKPSLANSKKESTRIRDPGSSRGSALLALARPPGPFLYLHGVYVRAALFACGSIDLSRDSSQHSCVCVCL